MYVLVGVREQPWAPVLAFRLVRTGSLVSGAMLCTPGELVCKCSSHCPVYTCRLNTGMLGFQMCVAASHLLCAAGVFIHQAFPLVHSLCILTIISFPLSPLCTPPAFGAFFGGTPPISKTMWRFFFCAWFMSLKIMSSRLLHTVVCGSIQDMLTMLQEI